LITASGTYLGSDTDDTIRTQTSDPIKDVSIFGGDGDGDDNIDLAINNSSVDGGTGNDQIAVRGSENIIKGRDVDDTITIQDGGQNDVDTGAGNDWINIAQDGPARANNSQYDGGGGDDRFNVTLEVGENDAENAFNPIRLIGGNGADSFTLSLDAAPYSGLYNAPDEILTIQGFDLGEDILVIDVSDPADPENSNDRPYSDIEVANSADGNSTEITVSYSATSSAPAVQAIIGLTGVTGLSLSDIMVLEPA
jgi:hypothetical protein